MRDTFGPSINFSCEIIFWGKTSVAAALAKLDFFKKQMDIFTEKAVL